MVPTFFISQQYFLRVLTTIPPVIFHQPSPALPALNSDVPLSALSNHHNYTSSFLPPRTLFHLAILAQSACDQYFKFKNEKEAT